MSDYEVIWAGRGAMPHELVNRELWRTKASLTDYAPGRGDFIKPNEGKAPPLLGSRWGSQKPKGTSYRCPCGLIRAKDRIWCGRCLKAGKVGRAEPVRHCRRCHKPLPTYQQRKGLVQCRACRRAMVGRGRAA